MQEKNGTGKRRDKTVFLIIIIAGNNNRDNYGHKINILNCTRPIPQLGTTIQHSSLLWYTMHNNMVLHVVI